MNLKNKLFLNHQMISWQISAVNQILDQVQQTRKVWHFMKLVLPLQPYPAQQAFLCGSGAKNEQQESKTARKMAQVKELGGVLPSPPPPRSPLFHFLVLVSFLARSNQKSLSTVFFCSETKRKRLLGRLLKPEALRLFIRTSNLIGPLLYSGQVRLLTLFVHCQFPTNPVWSSESASSSGLNLGFLYKR